MPADVRPLLVYNTSRSIHNTQTLIDDGWLPRPDVIIGCVGTEMYDGSDSTVTSEFQSLVGHRWSHTAIEKVVEQMAGVTRLEHDALHPFQSRWLWNRASSSQLQRLDENLQRAGFKASVLYSNQKYLDVLPAYGNKGSALASICQRKGISLDRVVVAGETANDASMLLLPSVKRIVVENALPELFAALVGVREYVSEKIMAEGVTDGLQHFGVIQPLPSRATTARKRIFGVV